MEIRIETKFLIENNLTISEYIYLKDLYEENNNTDIYKIIDRVEEDTLQLKGFIKLVNSDIVLRNKTKELFEGKGLFLKFLNHFPIKTPTGRYLSPLRDKTTGTAELKALWKKKFKNNPMLEVHAIRVLDAELKWRRKTGQLEFIHSIKVWLNKGDYDNYSYLLEEYKEEQENNHKDFM